MQSRRLNPDRQLSDLDLQFSSVFASSFACHFASNAHFDSFASIAGAQLQFMTQSELFDLIATLLQQATSNSVHSNNPPWPAETPHRRRCCSCCYRIPHVTLSIVLYELYQCISLHTNKARRNPLIGSTNEARRIVAYTHTLPFFLRFTTRAR
jgi:hypothetical protein